MGERYHSADFSERAQAEATRLYQQVIEDIQSYSEKLIRGFEERIKQHPYSQLVSLANTFIRYYNEDMPKEIVASISEWANSNDNSFSRALREQFEDASESSAAAHRIEKALCDQVYASFKHIDKVVVNAPVDIDPDAIMKDAEYLEAYYRGIDGLKAAWMDRFTRLGDMNSLYATMSEMLVGTFNHVEKIYDAARKDVVNVREDFEKGRVKTVSTGQTAASDKVKKVLTMPNFSSLRRNGF